MRKRNAEQAPVELIPVEHTEPELDAIAELAQLANLPAESATLIAGWLSRALPHPAILCLVGHHAPELATNLAEFLDATPTLLPDTVGHPDAPTVYLTYSPVSLPDREWNSLAHAARKGVPVLIGTVYPLLNPLPFGETLTIFVNTPPAPAGEWAIEPLRKALARLELAEWQPALRNHQIAEARALAQTEPLLERIPHIPSLFSDGKWEGTPQGLVSATSFTPQTTKPSDTEILQRITKIAPALEVGHSIRATIELTPAGVWVRLVKHDAVPVPKPEEDPLLESLRRELHAPDNRERFALCERVWFWATRLNYPELEYGYNRRIAKGRSAYEVALRTGSAENLTALLLALQEIASSRPEAEASGEPAAPELAMV